MRTKNTNAKAVAARKAVADESGFAQAILAEAADIAAAKSLAEEIEQGALLAEECQVRLSSAGGKNAIAPAAALLGDLEALFTGRMGDVVLRGFRARFMELAIGDEVVEKAEARHG